MDWTYNLLGPDPAAGLMVILILIVIAILGVKLVLSVPRHFLPPGNLIHDFLASQYFDLGTSVLTLLIFIVPVVIHLFKGEPKEV